MIRLTDLALPLDHPAEALPAAICARLGITADELLSFEIARREMGATYRYLLEPDFVDRLDSLYYFGGDTVTEMHPVACSASHTAEFAGLFTTTRVKSADLGGGEVAKGCDRAIAAFTGLPDDASLPSRVGWLGFPPDDTAWQMGDRSIRCFLWLDGERMTGSYRGAGPGKLKIHYASR